MSLYDEIINGTFNGRKTKIKKKGIDIDEDNSLYRSIIDGTYESSKTRINSSFFDEEENATVNNIDNSGWFKKSQAFEDNEGDFFSDAGKTVLGTVGDIGTHLTKGVMNIGEGIGDLITYGRAQYNENKGNSERANELRQIAQRDSVNELFNPIQEKVNENSILGDKSDNIVEGLGYVAGITAVGVVTGGAGTVATTATTFSSAMGQSMNQAYKEGANDDEAWKFGVISGLAEAGSELLFGGLGKASGALGFSKGITAIDDTLATKVSGIFKSTLGKNLSEYIIKAGAEGTEEVISGFIQALGQKITYKSEEDLGKLVKDQNLLEQFVSGAITSAIAQVPGQNGIYKTTKNGRDFISGLTQNEAKVYDKELSERTNKKTRETAIEKAYNEQIATQEKLGMNLTNEDKATIRQAVEEAYNSGRIQDKTGISSKEYEEIENNVKRDLEDGNISIDRIRETLGENQDITKDTYLQKSYYEEQQKRVNYQVEQTDNEKVNILYQSAADAGMNNNNVTRRKVELVAKLTKDTNRQYKFASPEQLKAMGYNENANGVINKETGEILINSHSDKGLQAIIGHETTHIFDSTSKDGKYTKEYEDLQKYAIEYAKEKGIYEDKVKNITNAYGNILKDEKSVNEELTADLIGDFLFNDEKFIENLSTKNRNVFQKIYDYIKHSFKLATAGSEEAKQLENLKYQFDKVYKTISEETNTEIKYHVSENFSNEIDKVLNNELKSNSQVKARDYTPKILVDNGIQDLPMLITQNHIKSTIYTKQEAENLGLSTKNINYHGLGKDLLIKAIDNLDNPQAIYKTSENNYLIVTEFKDNNGKEIIVPIQINGKGRYNDVFIDENQIKSVYGRNNLDNYINSNNFEQIYKKNEELDFNEGIQYSNVANSSINNSIASTNKNVNDTIKYSMPESENNSGSFYLQKNRFDVSGNENLVNAQTLFYRTRDDGQYYVQATDGSGKITYDGVFYGEKQLARSLGEEIANKIVNTSESTNNEIYLQSDNIKSETDYMMAHRPTETGAYASNITKGTGEWDSLMPEDVYEHPEWYFDMNQEYSKESFKVLKQIKNNSNAEITIYRATTGNKINKGDWVTLSKKYAEYHNNSQFKGEGNIIELKVKAKDVQYAGDDINEFGYFPQDNTQTTDNHGRILSKEQQEYFKNSKVKDDNGQLITVYHGTNNAGFTQFNRNVNYFTDNQNVAKTYTGKDAIYEGYINITNPITIDANEEIWSKIDINNILIDGVDDVKSFLDTYGASTWKENGTIRTSTADLVSAIYDAIDEGELNADGIIINNIYDEGAYSDSVGKQLGTDFITFNSNQFKNIDNINPTDNPDIRFSMTNDNYITGDDIAVKDMLKRNTEENNTIDDMVGKSKINNNSNMNSQNSTENRQEINLKTKAKNYINRSKTKFINDVIAKFGTSKIANTALLNSTVENIKNDIQNNGKLSKEQTNNYFNELYDNLKKIDTAYYDEYKDVKRDIQNTKFYIPDNVKNSIADYNNFRQKNMGNIIMTNNLENIDIDTKYKELSESYPELFPESITNISDQLQKIAEVTKDISKVETNVSAYNDAYMGKEYRKWAREEFGTAISNLTQDIHNAMRYNEDSTPEDKIDLTKEEVKKVYKLIPDAKKKYEKALAKEVLTRKDRIQVDRLLNGEIDIGELSKDSNQEGIIRLATAKAEYDSLQKSVNEYVKNIKQARIEQAEKDIGDLNRWKDKKIGFQYSRETPIRNIYDVAPKEIADNIVNKYFRSYIEVNEKKVVDNINSYNEQIKELYIETQNKYKIELNGKKEKVSESALIQLLGEKKITTQQIKEAGADVTKIENAVNKFRDIYNELIEKINDSMLDNGYAPMEYRKDYFPHFTEETSDTLLGKAAKLIGINISTKDNLPTDISGQTMNFKPGRTWFSNMLQRTTDVTDYDVLKGFDKYIRGASDLIYHTNDIQNLRALSTAIRGTYNDTEIQNKVTEIQESTTMNELEKSEAIKSIYDTAKDRSHLSKFIEWLDNYTNLLAGKKSINDRGSEKELNREMYSTMQSVESRFAANAIGGNVGVALTNFAPLAQATGEIKTTNIAAGIWQTMKASIKGDKSFASESQFITRRRGTEYLSQTTTDKVTNLLTKPLEFADNFTSEAIVRAKYLQNIQEGMSEQVALENADRYTASLMADRGRGALPTQFNNKNPIAKMINMFQVEVNNQWSYYFKDLPKNVQESGKNNLVGAYTKVMIGSYLMNELLGSIRGNSTRVLPDPIYIIKEFIKGLSDDDDDNDADTILSTLSEIAGNMPFVSLPATLLGAEDVGRVPLTGMVPDLSKIVGSVADIANGEKTTGEGTADITKELMDTLGSSLILPFGGAQIKKTIKGIDLYSKDKPVSGSYTDNGDLRYTVDEDIGSKVQAAIFGAYANPYAQDYVDSGYKTIKADNIDEMVGLGMNSTEYRKYKKELSAAGDTSDKNGYKQYVDDNGNIYWYDSKNDVVYNSNYEKTILDKDDLTKVAKTQEQLNYIDSLDISDEKKNIMANNLNKNSKKKIDMSEYSNYDSYEEYKYARDYPEKYSVISQISSYDDFQEYSKQISNIAKEYKELSEDATTSKQKTAISKQKKQEIQSYIESLPLNQCQKIMLEKEAGGYSIKNYKQQIYQYLESQDLTNEEKYNMWKELFE